MDGMANGSAAEPTINPTADLAGPKAEEVDLEAALEAHKRGEISSAAASLVMEQLMDSKVAELEARLHAMPGGAAADAIRLAVARLSESPPNWHQSSAHFAALPADHEDAGRRWCAILGGVLMVLAQCMVAMAVFVGSVVPSCTNSDQCEQKGMFCRVGWVDGDRCGYCGKDAPLPWQTDPTTGGTLNHADAYDFVGFNKTLVEEVCRHPTDRTWPNHHHKLYSHTFVASWCETCVSAIDTAVNPVTEWSHMAANVAGAYRSFVISIGTLFPTCCGQKLTDGLSFLL